MITMNGVVELSREGRVGIVSVTSPPVNALSRPVREGLVKALNAAENDPEIRAIVLICHGQTFFAGADIGEFGKPSAAPTLRDVHSRMESLTKPLIAAVHGTALGGGLETALAAHYRVAVPSAKFGLPEVKLGLLPGAGGTQRLPRVTGIPKALDLITSGSQVDSNDALEAGIIDAIVPETGLRAAAIAFAESAVEKPVRLLKDDSSKLDVVRGHPEVFEEFRSANERRFRGLLAPQACIEAVEGAVNLPFAKGMTLERELFEKLMAGPQSKALRYAFFAERTASRVKGVAEGTQDLSISKVGIVGAGTMGGGIAMNFANAGIPVTIVETSQEALERGLGIIKKNYDVSLQRGRFSAEKIDQANSLINGSLVLEDLSGCDLILEAVFERMEIKKELFRRLDRIVKQEAILASNTSYLDLNEIARATSRPEWVVGMHFFSPANVMKLVEVARGRETSDEVLMTAMKLARTIGKVGVQVGVGPGFVGNRMLLPRQREAEKLVLQGVMPWAIDEIMAQFGMPMGPFQMRDLAGLDLGWVRSESNGASIREVLCEMGRFGQKAGAGYYDYDAQRKPTPSPVTEKVIEEHVAKTGGAKRKVSDQEILERLLFAMINEGAKILEEKVAHQASDIDVVWLYGYGFPAYRGGPMFYADTVGLRRIVARMREFASQDGGGDWAVAPLLDNLAAKDETFTGSSA